jgi:hypothetical protein
MNKRSQTAQPHDANCLREIARLWVLDHRQATRGELSDFSYETIVALVNLGFIREFANLDHGSYETLKEWHAVVQLKEAWKYQPTAEGLQRAAQDAVSLASKLMGAAFEQTANEWHTEGYQSALDDEYGDGDDEDGDAKPREKTEEDSKSGQLGNPSLDPDGHELTPQNAPRDAAKLALYTPFHLHFLAYRYLGGTHTEAERAAWYALKTPEARASFTLELLKRWDAQQ